MEKFQKYCLSVLLVIICGNISAQISNDSVENIDCKKLHEIYNRLLNFQECDASLEFITKEKKVHYHAIHHKQNAGDTIERAFSGKKHINFYSGKSGIIHSENSRHSKTLENFERNSKGNNFTEKGYFKSKVSKIRNKDYLDLIG